MQILLLQILVEVITISFGHNEDQERIAATRNKQPQRIKQLSIPVYLALGNFELRPASCFNSLRKSFDAKTNKILLNKFSESKSKDPCCARRRLLRGCKINQGKAKGFDVKYLDGMVHHLGYDLHLYGHACQLNQVAQC